MWHRVRFGRRVIGSALGLLVLVAGCGAPASSGEQPRYPEKKRPEPLRSASDGEVMGANQQSPEDTLEASPTNEHPAPGWTVEDGKLAPDRERKAGAPPPAAPPPAPVASPPVDPEDCVKDPKAQSGAAASTTGGKKKRPCPPAEQQ